MRTISISEVQRNLHRLDDFDIVEIVDKKRKQVKGYFLDKKHRDIVEKLFRKTQDQKNADLEMFKRLSKNVSRIDPDANIIKMEDGAYRDLF
jgi:hypothetical protein